MEEYNIRAAKIIPYKNVYKIFTSNRNYALKKTGLNGGKLLFFLSAMDYLWQKGFYQMSHLIRNREGKLYVDHGSGMYFLTEWIEGKYPDFSQKEQLDTAVFLLAKLHQKGEGFDPPPGCIPRNDLGRWPDKWRQRIADLKVMREIAEGKRDDFDLIFRQIVDIALDDAYQALEAVESAGYLQYCTEQRLIKPFCHRDFVYHNLIYNHGKAFLIDFEYCLQDSRVIDLARFIRTTFVHHPWEIRTGERIVSVYRGAYPLTSTEEKLLRAVLLFPHDIWRTGHKWYFSGQRKKTIYHLICRQYRFYDQKYHLLEKLEQGFLSL